MAENLTFLSQINETFQCKSVDVRAYSPLTLAYIGDAIFDVIIRTIVVERANRPANQLHKETVKYVKAETQAQMIEVLMPLFTEDELAVYRRGKNSKPYTKAKNASYGVYLKATGFEAVIGYLYLQDNMPRIMELVQTGIAQIGMEI